MADRTCRNCGVDISHKPRHARNCSRTCQLASVPALDSATAPRLCRQCSGVVAGRSDRVFCSRDCVAQWHYESRPADYKASAKRWKRLNRERAWVSSVNTSARARCVHRDPGRVSYDDWVRIARRHRWRCAYCQGQPRRHLQMDHVVPLSRGGRHTIGNVLPACERCNYRKADALLSEWRDRQRWAEGRSSAKHYSTARRRRMRMTSVIRNERTAEEAAAVLRRLGYSVTAPTG